MPRIVDTDKIKDVVASINDELNVIKKNQKELLDNIQKIPECYRSKRGASDASEIIRIKYLNDVNELNTYTNTIDSYIKYFKWLVNNYDDNFNNSKKNFINISGELKMYKDNINNNIIFKKENINYEGNEDINNKEDVISV